MKRILAVLSLALVVSVGIGVSAASATHSIGEGPKQDLVSGTTQLENSGSGFESLLHVDAKSGPTGEDPRGHFVFRRSFLGTTDIDFSARVTCVNVNGNIAGVAGEVTKSKNPSVPEGSGVLINVEDRGHGAVDTGGVFLDWAPLTECPFFGSVDFQKGNFIVHDATP